MDEDWDILVVLDACRYDYFKEIYQKFFQGNLRKMYSPGSCTIEWCKGTFTSHYKDTIYVSSNPYINSVITLAGFNAKEHFEKIIDVWLFGWDLLLGTVPPQNVNKHLMNLLDRERGKRIIVHYLQPHAPYLSLNYFVVGYPVPDLRKKRILDGVSSYGKFEEIYRYHRKVEQSLDILSAKLKIGNLWLLKLREHLGMPPAGPADAVRRKYGISGVRIAYMENLMVVLETTTKLLSNLSGKIVIVSDHGECLGEGGFFEHPSKCRSRILRVVPYFVVRKILNKNPYRFSKYLIKLKLRLLRRLMVKNKSASLKII